MARYPEACDAFAKAEELSPEDANLRRNLALALQKAGRSAEAKQAFAEAPPPVGQLAHLNSRLQNPLRVNSQAPPVLPDSGNSIPPYSRRRRRMVLNLEFAQVRSRRFSVKRRTNCAMNFIRRWRHGPERDQEQLLVRLWTMNSMNADADGQLTRPASRLAFDARAELKPSLKFLSGAEIEKAVTEAAYDNQIAHNFRKHMNDGRRD